MGHGLEKRWYGDGNQGRNSMGSREVQPFVKKAILYIFSFGFLLIYNIKFIKCKNIAKITIAQWLEKHICNLSLRDQILI